MRRKRRTSFTVVFSRSSELRDCKRCWAIAPSSRSRSDWRWSVCSTCWSVVTSWSVTSSRDSPLAIHHGRVATIKLRRSPQASTITVAWVCSLPLAIARCSAAINAWATSAGNPLPPCCSTRVANSSPSRSRPARLRKHPRRPGSSSQRGVAIASRAWATPSARESAGSPGRGVAEKVDITVGATGAKVRA